MKRKKPVDSLTLSVECVRLFSKAFESLRDDLLKSKIDLRIITKSTRDYMMVAGAKRDELIRRIELKETEMIQPTAEKH